ncbi:MAG: hypothetical protein ACE5K0_12900, partial [Candidatus Methanofastidiosia archaeon]
ESLTLLQGLPQMRWVCSGGRKNDNLILKDRFDRKVRITKERLKHIFMIYLEMKKFEKEIVKALKN